MNRITTNKFDFAELIMNNWLYVDKTEYAYRLLSNPASTFYFCSRPRRFGKSLFISTLESIFQGKRELFENLYIGKSDYSFEEYPVLHFDFSDLDVTTYEDFRESFQLKIRKQAERCNIYITASSPSTMLDQLISGLGMKAVILIDEFDTPVTRTLTMSDGKSLSDKIVQTFSSFYSSIKANERNVRFLFITGITKLSNMSIFSQMNNLSDISMDQGFSAAFGYTQKELEDNFSAEIETKLQTSGCQYHTRNEFLTALRDYYDGYCFSNNEASSFIESDELNEREYRYGDMSGIPSVYNPVSIGKYFSQRNPSFSNFWDETGVSTLAVELSRKVNLLDIVDQEATVPLSAFTTFDISSISAGNVSRSSVLALLYYSGYLTQTGTTGSPISLRFPNIEVASSFTGSLVSRYSSDDSVQTAIGLGRNAMREGQTETFMHCLKSYLASFSYLLFDKDKERQYQLLFLSFCIATGLKATAEKHTNRGRIDATIESEKHVYIIEMKLNSSADSALSQIMSKEYYYGFLGDVRKGRRIHLLGIGFSTDSRNITDWKEEIITSDNITLYNS